MKTNRRTFIKWLGRLGGLAALGYPTLFEPNFPTITRTTLQIPGLGSLFNGTKIVFLCDFHYSKLVLDRFLSRTISMIRDLKPDVILLGGDYVNEDPLDAVPLLAHLSKLQPPAGIYGVLGNHDYWAGADQIIKIFHQSPIRMLVNETITLRKADQRLVIAGLDDAYHGSPNLEKTLSGIAKEQPVIVLVHEPDYADKTVTANRTLPLQLSGHSHGGQVCLPLIGPPVLPPMGRIYPAGLQKIKDTERLVYTSRGIGNLMPIRFNCRPEISYLELQAG